MARWWLAAMFALVTAGGAEAGPWYKLDPANTLIVDTTKGRIIVEMRPDFAPRAVERIKLLSREHVYDGAAFSPRDRPLRRSDRQPQ